MGSSFVISAVRDTGLRRMVKEMASAGHIPTLQVQWAPWTLPKMQLSSLAATAAPVNTTVIDTGEQR